MPRRDSIRSLGIQRLIVSIVAILMAIEVAVLLLEQQWLNAVLVTVIMAVVLAPTILRDRIPVKIPAEFLFLALLFTFGALFLGEIRDYYHRFWWWDLLLHGASGLLLGILGFLLVYVLNEDRRVALHLQPRFVALFAFLFAVSIGALWEIFEFATDRFFGTNMQKPMLNDPSGLTDSMWDLILDAVGAMLASAFGWWRMSRGNESFIGRWIQKFVDANPKMFRD